MASAAGSLQLALQLPSWFKYEKREKKLKNKGRHMMMFYFVDLNYTVMNDVTNKKVKISRTPLKNSSQVEQKQHKPCHLMQYCGTA